MCQKKTSRYGRTEPSTTIENPTGSSLEEFFTRVFNGALELFEALHLVQTLTDIVLRVHDRGVLHQNLSPANIYIDWNYRKTTIDQAQLTLTDFS